MRCLVASLLIFASLASRSAKAEEKSPMSVIRLDPEWPTEKVLSIPVSVINAEDITDAISSSERDAMLVEAGVEKETRAWNQLDKNMLFLRSGYLSIEQMQEKYPALNKNQLVTVEAIAIKHDAGHRL